MNQTLNPSRYEWNQLPWKKIHRQVFKLQRQIYRAASRQNMRLVHRLQRLLMRSWYARLLAVRRVSQENAGKRTAGIDGVARLTPRQRWQLAEQLTLRCKAKPVRRLWIDKRDGDKRPLGIPVMGDRAQQALVKLGLEPEWEAKFEPNSYGFRPGRSVHDAIGAIFNAIAHQPKYVLDADIAQCFERINQSALLRKLAAPPWLQRPLRAWLQAGVWEQGQWYPTLTGTPQGGVLSPLLANIALHGIETDLKAQFPATSYTQAQHRYRVNAVQVIRYADDLVVIHQDLAVIQAAQTALEQWLAPMGLALKPSKTRIVHTLESRETASGFDFLGFEIRQYPVAKTQKPSGFKTLIKPSKSAIQRHRQHLHELVHRHQSADQRQLIESLNRLIAGWSRYYSTVVSSQCFKTLDNDLRQTLLRWTYRQSSNSNRHATVARFWGIDRGLGWVFCTPQGFCLQEHQHTPIRRQVKVRSHQSPFDGDWPYWATRRGQYPGIPPTVALLLKRQAGKCAYCGLFFVWDEAVEIHHCNGNWRDNRVANLQALHRHCHDQVHGTAGSCHSRTNDKASLVEEPCAVKVASTVLEPSGGGDPFA